MARVADRKLEVSTGRISIAMHTRCALMHPLAHIRYTIDTIKKTQTNTTTGAVRAIRHAGPATAAAACRRDAPRVSDGLRVSRRRARHDVPRHRLIRGLAHRAVPAIPPFVVRPPRQWRGSVAWPHGKVMRVWLLSCSRKTLTLRSPRRISTAGSRRDPRCTRSHRST